MQKHHYVRKLHSILDDPDIAEPLWTLPIEECHLNLPNVSAAVDSLLDIKLSARGKKEKRS